MRNFDTSISIKIWTFQHSIKTWISRQWHNIEMETFQVSLCNKTFGNLLITPLATKDTRRVPAGNSWSPPPFNQYETQEQNDRTNARTERAQAIPPELLEPKWPRNYFWKHTMFSEFEQHTRRNVARKNTYIIKARWSSFYSFCSRTLSRCDSITILVIFRAIFRRLCVATNKHHVPGACCSTVLFASARCTK